MPSNEQSRVWDGVYTSFSEIKYERDVFEEAIWSDKQVKRAEAALLDSRSGRSPSGVTNDYALPVVAALAAPIGRPLRILVFGGGLGTSYIPLKSMLQPAQEVVFIIVENATMCGLGNAMFADDAAITFLSSIPAGERFDIVHAGSSIHYVDDWRGTIRQFAGTGPNYILFADLPAGDIDTFVTGQSFHGRQIPVRFWNVGEFSSCVEGFGYELIFKAAYAGGYLEQDASLTSHFDSRHRLDHFCQLVFRRKGESRITPFDTLRAPRAHRGANPESRT
jgi:putative methyltransferase (TIGR04325 family)